MLSNVFLRIRSRPGLEKQFRCIASMYRTSPRQSSLKESKLRGFPLLPTCGCGIPNITGLHISSTNALSRTDKMVGMRYEDGTLIYFGAKAPLVKGIQSVLYAMGAAVTLSSPYFLSMIDQGFAKYMYMSWVILFGVVNPSLYYKFTKRYVTELYHDKDTNRYTAIIPSPWIVGRKKVVFTAEDCSMPDSPNVFASFLVNKRLMLVSSDNMDYSEYSKMLRYASGFDYENPDRQEQYEETLQDAIQEMEKSRKQ